MSTAVRQSVMFSDPAVLPVGALLADRHYLGPATRGETYRDEHGVMVFANPSSRRLPQQRWLELVRWCIVGPQNAGSQQWRAVKRWLRAAHPHVTTIVSYSDPSAGHTGALYRACNWLWAPTWLRLRTPPTGNGDWGNGQQQAAKDRWIAVLAPDSERQTLLRVTDAAITARMPWANYVEPQWRGHRPVGGGADFKRWCAETTGATTPVA